MLNKKKLANEQRRCRYLSNATHVRLQKINITETKESSKLNPISHSSHIKLPNRFPEGGKVKQVKLVSLFSNFQLLNYICVILLSCDHFLSLSCWFSTKKENLRLLIYYSKTRRNFNLKRMVERSPTTNSTKFHNYVETFVVNVREKC